ncbi:MAG: hypothetical protein ACW99G_22640 [Candidatus Thorarchaeota archaeon]|jgi:hypothetical protein
MKNYNTLKNEALIELMEKYDLEKEDYFQDNGNLNRKKLANILKLIDATSGKADDVTVVNEDDGDVQEYEPTTKLHKSLGGMMVEITFYSSDENDLPYVQMALNGMALIIPRERKFWIPKEFIDGVLVNAISVKSKMEVVDGKIRYIPKQVPRFQHTVHDVQHIDVLQKRFADEKAKNKK